VSEDFPRHSIEVAQGQLATEKGLGRMNYAFDTVGLSIRMENTGLYEAPEVGGGDN
jgi:hypothetical protein